MAFENILWGGPAHKILLKFKLDLEPESVVLRKILFFSLFTWFPLFILSAFQSAAYNTDLRASFLTDFVVWARFFVALPLLFYFDRLIKLSASISVSHFVDSGIISRNNIADFETVLKKVARLRDSRFAESVILAISYSVVVFYWRVLDETNMSLSWLFSGGKSLTLAAYWYYFVSAPVFQFFLYRAIWKFILWSIFLIKISRMELNLFPINPDLSGGLNFLGITTFLFGHIGLAQGSVVSARIAELILINNAQLKDFNVTIVTNIFVMLVLFLSPMLFFVKKLVKVRHNGIIEYSVLSQKYVSSFHNKWVEKNNPEGEKLLGTADIQTLSDLFNSYQTVAKMSVVPFNLRQVLLLAMLVAVPFIPLVLFIVSPLEILGYLVGIFI